MQQNSRLGEITSVGRALPLSMGRARSILRARTCDLHSRAEEVLGTETCATLAGYAAMLQSNLSVTDTVRRATEPLLPPHMMKGLALDSLRLRKDLAELGAPACGHRAQLDLDEPAGAIGALYVLEGARLGGKLLARKVEAELGLTAEHGAAYLNGDGAEAGRRWRRFLSGLEERLVLSEDLVRAVAAARATFRLIIRRYEKIPK